jgi:hypothetical protein
MSARTRFFWIVPAVLVAFWTAFQSMAAVPPRDGAPSGRREWQLGEPQPPLTVAGEAIVDRLLRARIAGFAAAARAQD